MTQKERLGPKLFETTASFFGSITGLPIREHSVFPELTDIVPGKRIGHEVPFNYALIMGKEGDQYRIHVNVRFTDEWSPREWIPDVTWGVDYNNEVIFRNQYAHVAAFYENDFSDKDKIKSFLDEEMLSILGGPSTEIPFMNYEDYSLNSLKDRDRDSYFANIYLVLMTHMKSRGLAMPPILSKHDEIRTPTEKGKIREVKRLLDTILVYDAGGYDARCQAHMREEARKIQERALWEFEKRDLSIPIEKVFPDIRSEIIESSARQLPQYTILVVENDLGNFGAFNQIVKRALISDGRYSGTKLIRTCTLQDCMELSAANRLDLILFDWTNPSPEEVLMVRPDETNPFYDMLNGDTQAVLSITDEGIQFDVPSGKHHNEESLRDEAERIDIRERWMDTVREVCEREGVSPPPYFIVRSQSEHRDIARIVSQKLGNSLQ